MLDNFLDKVVTIMKYNLMLKAISISTLIFGLSGCSMMPNLSWLGLDDETVSNTNKTEMQASQQTSISPQPEVTKTDVQSTVLSLQNYESNQKMERHLQEWQEMKPSIARLVALEGEVKELIKQLKSKKVNSNLNVPLTDQSAQVKQNSIISDNTATNLQRSSVISENMYAIQLFSLTDKNIMRKTWNKLSTKHPNILGNLSPIYEEVSMQGKTFYRVKAGSFESKTAAMKLCSSLKNANTNCFLANSIGIAML
jgi:hypothetical protein